MSRKTGVEEKHSYPGVQLEAWNFTEDRFHH